VAARVEVEEVEMVATMVVVVGKAEAAAAAAVATRAAAWGLEAWVAVVGEVADQERVVGEMVDETVVAAMVVAKEAKEGMGPGSGTVTMCKARSYLHGWSAINSCACNAPLSHRGHTSSARLAQQPARCR